MDATLMSATSQEMMSYFMQLNDKERQSVLNLLKTFLASREENFTPQTLQDYNEEIEQGDTEIADGNFIPHEEMMKKYLIQ